MVPVHVIVGGADRANEPMSKSIVSLLHEATSRAWFATGYFVPDDVLLSALEPAGRVTPHRPNVRMSAGSRRTSPFRLIMSTKSAHTSATASHPSDAEIRDYAYHLYDQSGFAAGRDLDNWLEAKACLSSGVPKSESPVRLHQNSFKPHHLNTP